MTSHPLPSSSRSLSLTQRLVRGVGRLMGWRVRIDVPLPARCVIIGAHHTSGHDFFGAMLLNFGGGLHMQWVAKDTLFRPPLAPLMRALGGMPVRRDRRSNFVGQMIEAFARNTRLRLGILPEGTRQHQQYWKTGFYYIAKGAGVPILLGYIDYTTKVVGVGGALTPTANIEEDFATIRAFYEGVQGRHPHLHGVVAVRPVGDETPAEALMLG